MTLLFIVFILTLLVGFLLIFFIKKTSPEEAASRSPLEQAALAGLDFDQFFRLNCELLEKMGLKIKESYRDESNTADIYAENPAPFIGGPVVVRLSLYPQQGKISAMEVMNFSSDLVGDRRGKGLFITTGTFAPEVGTLPELPPMDFIDGEKLLSLWREHGIKLPHDSKKNNM